MLALLTIAVENGAFVVASSDFTWELWPDKSHPVQKSADFSMFFVDIRKKSWNRHVLKTWTQKIRFHGRKIDPETGAGTAFVIAMLAVSPGPPLFRAHFGLAHNLYARDIHTMFFLHEMIRRCSVKGGMSAIVQASGSGNKIKKKVRRPHQENAPCG